MARKNNCLVVCKSHTRRFKWPRSDARKRIVKIKKKIFATPAAAAAVPANPKIAAIRATMKNAKAHLNISPPQEKNLSSFEGIIGRACNRQAISAAIPVPFSEK
jgi:hypothetical protein